MVDTIPITVCTLYTGHTSRGTWKAFHSASISEETKIQNSTLKVGNNGISFFTMVEINCSIYTCVQEHFIMCTVIEIVISIECFPIKLQAHKLYHNDSVSLVSLKNP